MAVKMKKHGVSINPLKVSQPLGGTLAFQGFYRSMPIIHGSQGCAAFIKALMTRHYRDPIALQTSALQEMNVIFGADKCMNEALDAIREKHRPDLIGVFSTALTEVGGDDLLGNVKTYIREQQVKDCLVVPVSLPDYQGSLESGYSKAVEAVITELVSQRKEHLPIKTVRNRVNLLPGSHLTPGDVMELKEIISSFGLEVIVIPDLSTSLSGHLLCGFTPLSRGGIRLDELYQLVTAEWTIVVGASMERTAKKIEEFTGIPYRLFPSVTGLQASDEFFQFLQSISYQLVPDRYRWQRENLVDCMLDAHFYYAGSSAVVALEPDHLFSVVGLLKELGVGLQGLVSSFSSPILSQMEEDVWIGDFGDLEEMAAGADLWISNSHGNQGARRKRVPFVPIGFPIFEQLGTSLFTSVGYRGTTELIIKIGNQLVERGNERHEGGVCIR